MPARDPDGIHPIRLGRMTGEGLREPSQDQSKLRGVDSDHDQQSRVAVSGGGP
jgi:hypothetical protein